MCGLAGVVHLGGGPVDPALVTAMTRTIAHRGPDAEGVHTEPGVGLGHRRLSIIDLSDAGRQPLGTADGALTIVFNGEIYNYRELRAGLEARGHRFRTATDTETLLYLYREHGDDMLGRLRGMFAFALWDARARRLLLARDHMGQKPLFYAHVGDELVFGSEVKAVLAHPRVPRAVDRQALDVYLAHNYVAAPQTLVAAVRQLEPGERLTAHDGQVRRQRWFTPSFTPAAAGARAEAAWVDELETRLVDAVRSHLIADVPVGVMLSSGVDSGTLLGLTRRVHAGRVDTFTAGFREATYGEHERARVVARALGADHDVVTVEPPSIERLAAIAWHADEPTADMSMIPFWDVCALARRKVKVVLSGEGADEIFAGYDTYVASQAAATYRRVPAPLRALVRAGAQRLPPSRAKVTLGEKLQRFTRGAEAEPLAAHLLWRNIHAPATRAALLGGDAADPTLPAGAAAVLAEARAFGPLERLLYVDQRFYLPSDMLVKADRMSMAHGLEVRVPYLDPELVAFAARMPAALKLRRGTQTKWALRQVAERVLPPGARPPRKKLGFNVPFAAWLDGTLGAPVRDVLASSALDELGLLRPAVAAIMADHFERGQNRAYELYGLTMLALWQQQVSRGRAGA